MKKKLEEPVQRKGYTGNNIYQKVQYLVSDTRLFIFLIILTETANVSLPHSRHQVSILSHRVASVSQSFKSVMMFHISQCFKSAS